MTTLISISASLTFEGLQITKRVREYKETDKTFIGQSSTNRKFVIKKSELLVPTSRFQNKLGSLIVFTTVCRVEDEQKAIDILTKEIHQRVEFFKNELTLLNRGLSKPVIFKTLKTDDQ